WDGRRCAVGPRPGSRRRSGRFVNALRCIAKVKKTPLAYEIRRNRGPGAAISVVCPGKAGMFSRGEACRGKNQRPRSMDSRVAGNQDSEAYRQRLPWGDDESPGRNESKRECGLESE